MTPAERIILKCGGHQTLADWCDTSLTMIYKWTYPVERKGTGGIIPTKHIPVIIKKAKRRGITLEYKEFFE